MSNKKTKKRASPKTVARPSASRRASKVKPESRRSMWVKAFFRFWGLRLTIIFLVALVAFTAYLDIKIRKQFEGQKWALPAHVYTRPLELYVGQRVDADFLQDELQELGYQPRDNVERVGSYQYSAGQLEIHQRSFRFWDGLQQQQRLSIALTEGHISRIRVATADGQLGDIEIVRLEPRLFGSVSPLSHEDRTLLKLEDVPQHLIDALIAVEDRQFYSHFGINPLGIARAMLRNVSAGKVVQGGSTLTQQLVKNYYLTSDRTIKRKVTEVIMAILLEVHYSKQQILQAYLNEVYLSQEGNRAIHGFALGSRHFFGRPLQELELPELATLAGIMKSPSYYSPIRNPERARTRRDLVLKTMLEEGVIDQSEYQQAVATALRVSSNSGRVAPLSYPSFLGFVRTNLQDDYQQNDLLTDGLQIHTTLNPRIQQSLERVVREELAAIEKRKSIEQNSLQVAAVVIRTDNGEVAAMIGDRKASFSGFNRAVQARRPVGSLLKPFIYLAALESPELYNLATPLDDLNITVTQRGSPDWQPQNYDGKEHGAVMLVDALAKSYNLATVRLGMELGLDKVSATVHRLGHDKNFKQLPSILLGALPMTVMDVGQLYLSIASGGFKTPVKGVRSVLSNQNQPLARYPLAIEQVVEPAHNNLITYALQEVVRNGTARGVLRGFRNDYGLAGKTGTTNDYRDSWFAGFSGNYVAVVWVGRDDNKPIGLTGASGAARVWSKIMQSMPLRRLELPYNEEVIPQEIFYSVDVETNDCSLSRQLPILIASLPLERLPCAERMQYDYEDEDDQKHFESYREDQLQKQPKKKSFWKRIFG